MFVKEIKSKTQINTYLEKVVSGQYGFEKRLDAINRKKNGVFLTNSLLTVENVLGVVEIDSNIFSKRVLEPSCGQGIFLLKLLADIYDHFPDDKLISNFVAQNLFFVDVQETMVNKTIDNIKSLYSFLFNKPYYGPFNGITWDFTDKIAINCLFDESRETPFSNLYDTFDYAIGNPPYVSLYGRRDRKKSEEQRRNYLNNFNQFPDHIQNGKLNFVMLFIEHSLDFLRESGKLSFIIDVAFFETAYQHTRKYLLEKTKINELHINIKGFDVASGQVILKATKCNSPKNNNVIVTDWKTQNNYTISQSSWYNKRDEYKFRLNGCGTAKQLIDKINSRGDKTLLELYPYKNLRTCVMPLDMEDKFTFSEIDDRDEKLVYPYYQGSKALSEKYGRLYFAKYFYYDKPLQDAINEQLKVQLEKEGIKNKKRIGLGETIIYDNPKVYIRQSAKEIIATVDIERSSANNSLYVFSLRNNNPEVIEFLYFLCGWLNSDLVTFYSQQMNIIRFSQGKQPQIKISDLGTIFIPSDKSLQKEISSLSKTIYENLSLKDEVSATINSFVCEYYDLSGIEIESMKNSIITF